MGGILFCICVLLIVAIGLTIEYNSVEIDWEDFDWECEDERHL